MSESFSQDGKAQDRFIIHHLSDLHFHDEDKDNKNPESNRELKAFRNYLSYVQTIDAGQRPHFVVITGDLTRNGDLKDFSILRELLRTIPLAPIQGSSVQDEDAALRICLVPGPHDIGWDKSGALNFETFYQTFSDFIIPSPGERPKHLRGKGLPTVVVYPIQDCFAPETLPKETKNAHTSFSDRYERFRVNYTKRNARPRLFQRKKPANLLATLRSAFLRILEERTLTYLDIGEIRKEDLGEFQTWGKLFQANRDPHVTVKRSEQDPLKILITHHPLLIQTDADQLTDPNQPADTDQSSDPQQDKDASTELLAIRQRFKDLLQAANDAKFQLALHGHLHKPHVLSDLSIIQGPDVRFPLRQAGAGSLGDSNTFNEIIAVNRQDGLSWRLEIRVIDVNPKNGISKTSASLVLLNPVEDIARRAEERKQQLDRQEKFTKKFREIIAQYAESVAALPIRHDDVIILPQKAMNLAQQLVRDAIFEDAYDLNISLALKQRDKEHKIWVLENAYLTPGTSEPSVLLYPASIGAWSMALGRELIYPDISNRYLSKDDYEWLQQTSKIPILQKALDDLIAFANGNSAVNQAQQVQYQTLGNAIGSLQTFLTLKGTYLYQNLPLSQSRDFPVFISVPIPFKSYTMPPILPEIGALTISAKLKDGKALESKDVFTPERIDMLKTLSDLLAVILTSSSALKSPPGSWNGI